MHVLIHSCSLRWTITFKIVHLFIGHILLYMNILTAGVNGTPLFDFATHVWINHLLFFNVSFWSAILCQMSVWLPFMKSFFFYSFTCRINHLCTDEKVNLINDQDETLSLNHSAKAWGKYHYNKSLTLYFLEMN